MNNSFIISIIERSNFQHTEDQLNCLKDIYSYLFQTFSKGVHIVNGYAGTGKTTLIAEIVDELSRQGYNIVLLAPTGRAAKVLSSYCNYPAFTIHKHIYLTYRTESGDYKIILAKNKTPNTIFFVDEASMLSDSSKSSGDTFYGSLLDDLINFVFSQKGCKLVMIGDVAQLPPVFFPESPALLPDTYLKNYSLPASISNMKQVVRQSQDSPILSNATFIREKLFDENFTEPFFMFYDKTSFPDLDSYALGDEINSSFASLNNNDSVILCRSNKKANLYNRQIRSRILFYDNRVVAGEKLMVIKNNYFWLDETNEAQFIANGEMIEIKHISKIENLYGFNFAHATISLCDFSNTPNLDVILLLDTLDIDAPSLPFEDSTRLYNNIIEDYFNICNKKQRHKAVKIDKYYNALHVKYGYAMTCHKAQGGQWDNVFIDLSYYDKSKIDKEYFRWLYTAVTRAKMKVIIIK